MNFKQIFILFFVIHTQSSSVIDIVFTVKNLSTNDRLKSNFFTMISSLFEHTSIDNLRLHVIGDFDSHQFVVKTLENLHYQSQVFARFVFLQRTKTLLLLSDRST